MHIVLAVITAVFLGCANVCGGLLSRNIGATAATVVVQTFGIALILPLFLFVSEPMQVSDLLWGAAAGFFASAASVAIWRAMSLGRMTVVAPIAAVTSTIVPALFGVASGESLHLLPVLGILMGIASVVLVSMKSDAVSKMRVGGKLLEDKWPLLLALWAGAGFGSVFICLSKTSQDASLWPLLSLRVVTVIGLGLVLMSRGRLYELRRSRDTPWRFGALCGALFVFADAGFIAASHLGPLAIVGALVSIFGPVVAVFLARVFLREKMYRLQEVGFVLSLISLGLITIG